MATFDPIPYTYVPTAPRSKSAAAHRKPASKQFNAPHERQRNEPRSTTPDGPRLSAPAPADPDRGYVTRIQETSAFHDGSDDEELPTIEEILYPTLQRQGFATTDLNPHNEVLRVEETASKRDVSMNHNKAAASDSSGSPDNPIDLLGDDDSSAPKAEDDDSRPRAESSTPDPGFFDGLKTAIGSTISASPSRSEGWYDIDNYIETGLGLQLAEHGAFTPNSMRTCSSASHLLSEPRHERISKEGCEKSESHSNHVRSSPSRFSRESQEDALGQADHARIGRSEADDHELPSFALDIDAADEGERQEAGQEAVRKDQGNDENGRGQFQVKVEKAERVSDAMMDAGLGLAQRPRLLPTRDPWTSHDETESRGDGDSDSYDELDTRFDSDQEYGIPPRKRKQPWSSSESVTHKKRKFHFQHKSSRRLKPNSKPCRRSESYSPFDQTSKVAAFSSAKDRLRSAPQAMRSEVASNYNDPNESSGNDMPTLMKITLRPQSLHCFSFTAVFRDGGGERGVSFAQLTRIIESTGHVGKIDDLAIKAIEHQSFLATGFTQHASSRRWSMETATSVIAKTSPTYEDARSSDDKSGLSDSDLNLCSDDAGSWGQDKQVDSSPRKHKPWSDLDEQRLLAYKKEGKHWDWIFQKFPGRTQPAIRTRWSIIRPRDD